MSLARESELELKLELTRDELTACGRIQPWTISRSANPLRARCAPSISTRPTIACGRSASRSGCGRTARAGGNTVKSGTGVEHGVSSSAETETVVDHPEPDLEAHRQSQDPPQGRESRSKVDPGAGIRDDGGAHHRLCTRATARSSLPRRGRGARRQRRGRPVRGGAGAESGVPECLLTRRPSCFGPAHPPRQDQQGRARLQPGARQDERSSPRRAATRRAALLREEQTCAEALGLSCSPPPIRSSPTGARCSRRRIPCCCAPAAHRPAASAQRAARVPPAARHARAARVGGARPGPGAHGRGAARCRRADRAHLCPRGRADQGRSRRAARARGARRPPRQHARPRTGGARGRAMVGAAAVPGAVAAHHRGRGGPRAARSRSSPAPPSSGSGRRWPTAASGSTTSPSSSATRCARP